MLPPLPQLDENATENEKAIWLWMARLRDGLQDFTPSQMAAALDIGSLGVGPGSVLEGATLPVSPPVPDTPTGLQVTGLYQQMALSWDLDPNPFITGWEVQRADDLSFTSNVQTRTSARALAFLDEGLGNNDTKYYRIRALTQDPNNFSPFSAVQFSTTLGADTTVLQQLQTAALYLQRAHIRNAVIDSAKITNAAIITALIADAAITSAKIANLAVGTAQMADLAVTNAKLGNASVTNLKVNDVAADKLTAGTVNVLVKLTNNNIQLDGANAQIKIFDNNNNLRILLGILAAGPTDWGLLVFDAGGNVMFDTRNQGATSFGVQDLAIISSKLADLAVLTSKIADLAVSTAKLIDQSVTTGKRQLLGSQTFAWSLGPNEYTSHNFVHNLGVVPIVIVSSGSTATAAWVAGSDTSATMVALFNTINNNDNGTVTVWYM